MSHGTQRWAGLAAATVALGCSFIRVGDDGDGDPAGCNSYQESLGDLDTIPPGFDESPAELLTAIPPTLTGVLALEAGGQVPVRIDLAVASPPSAEATYDTGRNCEEYGVGVNGTATIDSGDVLSGITAVTMYVQGDIQQVYGGDGTAEQQLREVPGLTSSVPPAFAGPPTTEPSLGVSLAREGTEWGGYAAWDAEIDCTGVPRCFFIDESIIGHFHLQP
ncbi:MAG TPA: hypothetical protein PLU22_07905 [Polyangiaceae bacterium]|nr:hypothetical protein [Polyangiaceae bacterium]